MNSTFFQFGQHVCKNIAKPTGKSFFTRSCNFQWRPTWQQSLIKHSRTALEFECPSVCSQSKWEKWSKPNGLASRLRALSFIRKETRQRLLLMVPCRAMNRTLQPTPVQTGASWKWVLPLFHPECRVGWRHTVNAWLQWRRCVLIFMDLAKPFWKCVLFVCIVMEISTQRDWNGFCDGSWKHSNAYWQLCRHKLVV